VAGDELAFRIRSSRGEILTSGESTKGGPPIPFDVKLGEGNDVFLEAFALHRSTELPYADWLGLKVGPGEAQPTARPHEAPSIVDPEEPWPVEPSAPPEPAPAELPN
jgi:hypothetical protein